MALLQLIEATNPSLPVTRYQNTKCTDLSKLQAFADDKKKKTRCVCETLMPPKHHSFEKHDPDI